MCSIPFLLAPALAVWLTLLGPAPAWAQTTLVSNTGQTLDSGTILYGQVGTNVFDRALSFTTGSNSAGYTLSAVDVYLSGTANVQTRVSIYSTSGTPPAPDSSLHVLNHPSSFSDNAVNTFSANSGASLDANTTYAVVVHINLGTTGGNLGRTASDNEDSGAAAGWSIANRRFSRVDGGAWTEWSNSQKPLIAIKGTIKGTANTETEQRSPPQPLQLVLWTDKPAYRAGEPVRLYLTLDPHNDRGRYRTFVYLERPAGDRRRYLAPLSGEGRLHAEAVDSYGRSGDFSAPGGLSAADRELIWEGPAPAPGLWQFVLELRPGTVSEQDEEYLKEELAESLRTRRAWARFTVAERSRLLNRHGFDREIRSDLTLHSDTIYYLGHQLFVHDGATLTIEPGTVVRAWGRNAAIIVEPGGRIVAEGTREAPVVLGCSQPVGQREPGCWGGLRILGRAPVTRSEGVAPGVLPPGRPVYGGTDTEGSSGVLRFVRVEFAGAGAEPDAAAPAIGLYGAGSGTVVEHVQAHASLGDGIAFSGGAAGCQYCVASGSGAAGLSWERGWRGTAAHLYVQHASGGTDGIGGAGDEQGWDLEPRSLPELSNVTLLHSEPYGRREREGAGLRLRTGSGVTARDLLVDGFVGGPLAAGPRAVLLFEEGASSVSSSIFWLEGVRLRRGPLRSSVDAGRIDYMSRLPRLLDVRWFANPDPRPKASSAALKKEPPERPGEGAPGSEYIGALGKDENWLEGWTVFGPESVYDIRERDEEGN